MIPSEKTEREREVRTDDLKMRERDGNVALPAGRKRLSVLETRAGCFSGVSRGALLCHTNKGSHVLEANTHT